jgi:hypothetical protein
MTHAQVLEKFIKQIYTSCDYPAEVDIAKEIKVNNINKPTQYTYAPYVSFDDRMDWGSLDITYECEDASNPEDFFNLTDKHLKAVVELTGNALRLNELHSLTIDNASNSAGITFTLRLSSHIYLEVTSDGEYELYERVWSNHKVIKEKTYKNAPTVAQLKALKKIMFSSCLDYAKRQLKSTIEALESYNEEYKKEKAQLEYIESLLS